MALEGIHITDRQAEPAPQPEGKPKHPLTILSHELDDRRSQFGELLRANGIEFDTFKAAALTGLNKNPDLYTAEKASLFDALSQSCRDGLMPDGREGALVIHSTNIAKPGQPKNYVDKVAWMPMVRGVLKKIRNAEGIASVHDGVIYKGDDYRWWTDDEGPHLKHAPSLGGSQRPEDILAVYAIVKLTNGERQIEVVGRPDLEKMRMASKTGRNGKGPWSTWYERMALKGAWHRLATKLPLDDDIMRVINRDEALYDFQKKDEPREQDATPRVSAAPGRSSRLSTLIHQQETRHEQQQAATEHDAGGAGRTVAGDDENPATLGEGG